MKPLHLPVYLFTALLFISFTTMTPGNWETDIEKDGVEFSSATIQHTTEGSGEIDEYVLHRITNTNSYAVDVTWQKLIWYNNVCRNCNVDDNSSYTFTVSLAPGETLEGSISDSEYMLKTHSKRIKPESSTALTKYEFSDITIKKTE